MATKVKCQLFLKNYYQTADLILIKLGGKVPKGGKMSHPARK